jgi:hypothetical protein
VSAHVVQWVTASPLWPSALETVAEEDRRTTMRRPALLRFERDSFMDDVAKLLERDPAGLADTVATPVTYRLPAPGETEPPVPADLKLFQAAHGHFYLVAATLVCRMPGLPEHEVNTAAKEKVSFVLRRVEDGQGEWAWVDDPEAKAGKSWKLLDANATGAVDRDEELLPLFPLRYTKSDRLRRLFVGLVPTTSGEAFKAAGSLSPLAGPGAGAGAPSADPRPDALTAKVTDPLRALVATVAASNDQIEASSFLLLDFAEFLYDQLGWFATDAWTQPTRAADLTLWNTLAAPAVAGGAISWRQALTTAWHERLILFGDAEGASSLSLNLRTPGLTPDQLDAHVAAALPPLPAPDPSAPATSLQGDTVPPPPVPKLDARSTSRYVLRCVYQRPECGPLHPDVVSDRSDPFRIAGFFDLDAPARSIMISMPVDTSLKDLRKLKKNVSFLLSNELRAQMNRVTDLQKALDGDIAAGESVDLGLICSFSLPVITICALIVLMIFINLLNIVFWWMPLLKICFPIGLKAK